VAVAHKRVFLSCLSLCLLILVLALAFARPALAASDDAPAQVDGYGGGEYSAVSALDAPDDAPAQAADDLRAVAGTDETVIFWNGGTAGQPGYTWIFNGLDISKQEAARLTSLDLGIVLTVGDADGSGAPDTLMLAFSHEGELPLPARLSVALPANFEGTSLSLFSFDERSGAYGLEAFELAVQDGSVSFKVTGTHARALSSLDLTAKTGAIAPMPLEAGAPGGNEPVPAVTPVPAAGQGTAPFLPPTLESIMMALAAACALAVVLDIVFDLRHRYRAAIAATQRGWPASTFALEDIPSLDELMTEAEEPPDEPAETEEPNDETTDS
jgi:hypothetical protein